MADTHVTITGNLTDNPELKHTPNGNLVANFRLAVTARVRGSGSPGAAPQVRPVPTGALIAAPDQPGAAPATRAAGQVKAAARCAPVAARPAAQLGG